jgi:two-component system response regulator HydG
MSSGPLLHTVDLPTQLQNFGAQRRETAPGGDRHGNDAVISIADMEKQAILETIRQLKGDKLMAARLLGIGKTTLYRKLKEYGLAEATESMGD